MSNHHPTEFYSEFHFGSEHDLNPNDVHFGISGNLSQYFTGEVSPYEPFIGPLIVVNPAESPPTGWGSPNNQRFATGHTSNVPTNESAEQGMGVGPERKWPHYPHAENPNPFRTLNCWRRSGTDNYSGQVYRPEAAAFWHQGLIDSIQHATNKQRSPVNPIIGQAPSSPYVDTIPPLVDY